MWCSVYGLVLETFGTRVLDGGGNDGPNIILHISLSLRAWRMGQNLPTIAHLLFELVDDAHI